MVSVVGRFEVIDKWSRRSSTGSAPGSPGVTCRRSSGRIRLPPSVIGDPAPTGRGMRSTLGSWLKPMPLVRSTGPSAWVPRSTAPTSTPPLWAASRSRLAGDSSSTQGAESNHTNLRAEPPDHALGRSRGGLSTKIHQLVDGRGRPLVIAVTPGQAGDSPMLEPLLSPICEFNARAQGRPGPSPMPWSGTRPTPPAPSAPVCVRGASPR